MGAWNSSLFGNDTTCDIRDSYTEHLQDGMEDSAAYEKLRQEYGELFGTDEEPLFWFALADTQWKYGRLTPDVKSKALDWIEKGGGLELWAESKGKGSGWKKTLLKLKEKLEAPMPARKTVKKPEPIKMDLWELNDIYAYQMCGKESVGTEFYGKYILMQKIGTGTFWSGETGMRIQLFDKLFDTLPALEDIDGIRILPVDFPDRPNISHDAPYPDSDRLINEKDPIWMNALWGFWNKRAYPKKYLTFIGNKAGPQNYCEFKRELSWGHIDGTVILFYNLWKGLEYKEVSEGYFEFDQDEYFAQIKDKSTK